MASAKFLCSGIVTLDRSQSLFYFVPQENITVKLARLDGAKKYLDGFVDFPPCYASSDCPNWKLVRGEIVDYWNGQEI